MTNLFELDQQLARYSGKNKPVRKARPKPVVRSAAVYSRPFYGTGEHVLTGKVDLSAMGSIHDKYMLDVNSVKFTYGEIMAMGDLYKNYSQMTSAPQSELKKLRKLIRNSTRFYEAKVRTGTGAGKNTSDQQWQTASNKRYFRLAEENFSHFAPSDSQLISGFTSAKVNHRQEWEYYHQNAMETAKQGKDSNDTDEALAINAFGDHFLTDAFAAGHLFNKDDLNSYFKSRVFSGSKLNANGNKLMDEIARKAFKGNLKARFSKYETYEPYPARWNIINWNPNIHKLSRFEALLKAIMHEEPDIIGKSLIAKIVHDKLNGYPGGVPVADANGNHWQLTGDSSLNTENLAYIQEAVKRSIMNVHDAVDGKALAYPEMFARVWDMVPRPTTASRKIIKDLVKKYTNPLESEVSDVAANLLTEKLDDLLDVLVSRKKLKKA